MKKIAGLIALSAFAVVAIGSPSFTGPFNAHFKVKKGGTVEGAKCKVCHSVGKTLNAFGKDMAAAMAAAKTKKLTPEVLAKLEGLDSNKNGKKNIDDIKADKLP